MKMTQELFELKAVLAHIQETQRNHIARYAEQHATLSAITEAFNTVCKVVDPSCCLVLESPDAFTPTGSAPPLNEQIQRCWESGTLMHDPTLHKSIMSIENSTQMASIAENSYVHLLPLLSSWVSGDGSSSLRNQPHISGLSQLPHSFKTSSAMSGSVPQATAANSSVLSPWGARIRQGFTLLHEGVRLLGDSLLPRKDLRSQWRGIVVALENLAEDQSALLASKLDPNTVSQLAQYIKPRAAL